MWKFLVKNQSIEILEREMLADHQIQYVQLKFIFDGDWKKFHKVVQFSQCDEVYHAVLGFDGTSCYLPAELHVGAVKMSVFGYDAESDSTVRATTVPVTLNIRPSGFVGDDDDTPIPPTLDLYAQLLKKISEATKGEDGKSAYELAVQEGYTGTLDEWLASLHGKDGSNGKAGKNGTDGQPGADGASAYEIAVAHGFIGTEAEWLESLKAIADLSDYATIEQLNSEALSIREAMLPLERELHSHNNKAVLDTTTASYTVAEKEKLSGISVGANMTVVDTHLDENSMNAVANAPVSLALNVLNLAKHTHDNAALLDSITSEEIELWDSVATVKLQINGLSTELTVYKGKCDNNAARIATAETDIANAQRTLESLQAQIDNLHPYDTGVTLFHYGAAAMTDYGESIYTFYNDGYRSLSGFTESYPNFCSADNGYCLYYNLNDFSWGGIVFTMSVKSVHVTTTKSILISYKSGANDTGEMWLVPKSPTELSAAETARYIYEHIQAEAALSIPFNWLYSTDSFITVLLSCTDITAGDYFLAWKGVSDNTRPQIRMIKILEVST